MKEILTRLKNELKKLWRDTYESLNSYWAHDDNPLRPHALLTSGMHSNGFFNSKPVIADLALLAEAAADLLQLFFAEGGDPLQIQGVVGPQTGATKLAQFMSGQLGNGCFAVSPQKAGEGEDKSMILSEEDSTKLQGKDVLLCDDVVTTSGSVRLAAAAVIAAGGKVLPYILCLVNRSGLTEVDGRKIIALIDQPMPMWTAEDCPLCKVGSEAIRPKENNNWARLTAAYQTTDPLGE